MIQISNKSFSAESRSGLLLLPWSCYAIVNCSQVHFEYFLITL